MIGRVYPSDLFSAAKNGIIEELKVKMDLGVNINSRDTNGNTPLILAVTENIF